jgi:DNA-binding transcriptional ArsR family regulator
MSGVIERLQERTTTTDETPRIIEMTDADADDVLDTLGAETRREAFRLLFEEPRTPSELADTLDTSIQNVDYHLSALEEVGLVERIDTVYSAKGNEMTVYGPANDPLVFVGENRWRDPIEQTLRNVVTGLGLLAGAALLVQWGAEAFVRSRTAVAGRAGPAGHDSVTFSDGTVGWVVFDVLEPGVLFFVVALLFAAVVAYTMDGQ